MTVLALDTTKPTLLGEKKAYKVTKETKKSPQTFKHASRLIISESFVDWKLLQSLSWAPLRCTWRYLTSEWLPARDPVSQPCRLAYKITLTGWSKWGEEGVLVRHWCIPTLPSTGIWRLSQHTQAYSAISGRISNQRDRRLAVGLHHEASKLFHTALLCTAVCYIANSDY